MRVGVVDTTFSRVDMAAWAIEELQDVEIERYTVPGIKDLGVASKKLIEEFDCDIVLALGWVGREPIDETCAHESNLQLMQAELMVNKHIITVFVHANEKGDVVKIAEDRTRKHARNALALLKGKEELSTSAGQGKRQGHEDAGSL